MDIQANQAKMPLITVITCTRNSARYLAECLASLEAQTYRHIEHICIDAASTDGTLKIMAEHAPRCRVIQQQGQGLYNALNQGLAEAAGDIIGFLHSDDVLADAQCLERIAAAFIRNPKLGFYCSRLAVYDEGLKKPFAVLGAAPHTPSWREQLYSSNYYAHPAYYCSAEAIRRTGRYDEQYRIAGDIDWLIRLEKTGASFYFDPRILVAFRAATGLSARHYISALKEEWSVRKKNNQASFALALIYGWHFFRRIVRLLLERLGLAKAVAASRHAIFALLKS